MQQQSVQTQHPNPSQQHRTAPQSPATTTAPSAPIQGQHFQHRPHVSYHQQQQYQQHYSLQQQEANQVQHIRAQHQPSIRPGQPHSSAGGVQQQQHPSDQQQHPSVAGPSPFQSQPSSVQSIQEQEIGNVSGQPRLAQAYSHVSHPQQVMVVGQRHPTGNHQSQQQQQMLISQQQSQQQHPNTAAVRIEQSGQVVHMHPAPPAPPPHQLQRIFVQQQQSVVPPFPAQTAHDSTTLHAPPPLPHPHLYIGSQRFTAAIMAEMDVQPNISPKQKYRDLKKKFKYLVYENEYYQEELRNLQRKLLKLSRDKNFLLDRLGQYEQLSESSDDSDASSKTLEDRGAVKQKKKPKPSNNRKRAAPNTSGGAAGQTKRIGTKTTPAKSKVSSDLPREVPPLHRPIHSQVKEETEPFANESVANRQRQSDGREDSTESGDKKNEVANCSSVISANSAEC